MSRQQPLSNSIGRVVILWFLAFAIVFCETFGGAVSSAAESIDQLYEKAKKEGKVTIYAPFSARAMTVIPAGFMKRFPGVTVDHIDGRTDFLIARVMAESR